MNAELGPESTPEQQAALVIFDDTRVHDARLVMSPEDWDSILQDTRGDEWRRATFFLDGVIIAEVGVRPSGESSRVPGNAKMSMRLGFDAFRNGRRLGGFDSIKLTGSWDDPFIVRDRLAYWYMRQMTHAPREVAARLTVNGQSRGVYEIEEIWGREAIAGNGFSAPYGPLYRVRGMIGADPYAYRGPEPALYVPLPWDAKGDHDDDHTVIGRALQVLNEQPDAVGSVFDLDSVLSYFAGNAILANTDGFTGLLEVDDHFQYFDPAAGKLVMLPWDLDNTFGSINDPPQRGIFENYDKSVLTRLLRDTSLREAFFAKMEAFMARVPLARLNEEADRIYEQIRTDVAKDQQKQYPTEHFDWSLGYVKDFIATRYASVQAQIAAARAQPPMQPTAAP